MHCLLSEIMNLNGESRTFEGVIGQDTVRVGRDKYPITEKQPLRLKAYSVGTRSVVVECRTELKISVPCDRCLEPVMYPFDIDIKRRFDFDAEGRACTDDDEELVSYIDGYDLDADAMIGEEVIIGFPMKVLCEEDCKGICKICGANLNKGECGCDRTELDPRMSIIKDLFKMKEV